MHLPGGIATYDGHAITWEPTVGRAVTVDVPDGHGRDYWDWFKEERLPDLLAGREDPEGA